MTVARRAELRALVLEAIADRGKASLRDLELDIAAGRRALAEILDELHRDQLIVQVAGYRGRMAWAIASAVERGRAVPSGVAAGDVPAPVETVEGVTDEQDPIDDEPRMTLYGVEVTTETARAQMFAVEYAKTAAHYIANIAFDEFGCDVAAALGRMEDTGALVTAIGTAPDGGAPVPMILGCREAANAGESN